VVRATPGAGWPSKWNGLVTTPTVRMPSSRAALATTGEAPVPVSATHARGDEHHVSAGQVIADLVDHLLGGGAADVGLRTGAETFGHRHAHLDDAFGPSLAESLRIRVGDDEIDALEPCTDHAVQGVTARAADTDNRDPRLQLADVGNFEIVHPIAVIVAAVGVGYMLGLSTQGRNHR
jgi:hypothetical protein